MGNQDLHVRQQGKKVLKCLKSKPGGLASRDPDPQAYMNLFQGC